MTNYEDVIEAFVDNEPVGAGELAAALAAPDGRQYLIDLLVLRGLVSDGLPDALKPGGAIGRSQPAAARRSKSMFWLPVAAAALVTVGLGAGFIAGRALDRQAPSTPPVVTQTPAVETGTAVAPAPTHVIRMEKGVDWNERSGGN
jgi:anti-sigma factor RsiW